MSTTPVTTTATNDPAAAPTAPVVAVVAKKSISNGAIAVTLRANNDPTSDFVATLYVGPKTTQAEITSWLAAEKQRVADQHTALQNAHSLIDSIK